MNTITEDYVSLETAKLLKEKGFLKGVDLKITQNLSFYDNIGLAHDLNRYYDRLIQDKIDFVVAPTLQMAMKWLREVHYLFIELKMSKNTFLWGYRVSTSNGRIVCFHANNFNKYEEACEAAIKYCLEHLI